MNHHAQAQECRLLLLVVLNVPQCLAPGLDKHRQLWGHHVGRHKAETADRHRCIFQETLDALGVHKHRHELRQQIWDPCMELGIRAVLQRNLTGRPRGIVAHAGRIVHMLRADLRKKQRHELWQERLQLRECMDRQVTQQRIRRLADRRLQIRHAWEQLRQDRRLHMGNQLLALRTKTLAQTTQQIQRHNEERTVGQILLTSTRHSVLVRCQVHVHNLHTTLVHGQRVRLETCAHRNRQRCQALQQRDQVRVRIVQRRPLGCERLHERVNVLGAVQRRAHTVGQRANSVVQYQHVLLVVLVKSHHQCTQHGLQERRERRAHFLLERGKGAAPCFLDTLVVVEHHGQEPFQHGQKVLLLVLHRGAGTPAGVAA